MPRGQRLDENKLTDMFLDMYATPPVNPQDDVLTKLRQASLGQFQPGIPQLPKVRTPSIGGIARLPRTPRV